MINNQMILPKLAPFTSKQYSDHDTKVEKKHHLAGCQLHPAAIMVSPAERNIDTHPLSTNGEFSIPFHQCSELYELAASTHTLDHYQNHPEADLSTKMQIEIDYNAHKLQHSTTVPIKTNTTAVAKTDNPALDSIVAGTFLINGMEVEIDAGDTLQQICDKINATNTAVASLVDFHGFQDSDTDPAEYQIITTRPLYKNESLEKNVMSAKEIAIVDRDNCFNTLLHFAAKTKELDPNTQIQGNLLMNTLDPNQTFNSLQEFVDALNSRADSVQSSPRAYLTDSDDGTKQSMTIYGHNASSHFQPRYESRDLFDYFRFTSEYRGDANIDFSQMCKATISSNDFTGAPLSEERKLSFLPFDPAYPAVGGIMRPINFQSIYYANPLEAIGADPKLFKQDSALKIYHDMEKGVDDPVQHVMLDINISDEDIRDFLRTFSIELDSVMHAHEIPDDEAQAAAIEQELIEVRAKIREIEEEIENLTRGIEDNIFSTTDDIDRNEEMQEYFRDMMSKMLDF